MKVILADLGALKVSEVNFYPSWLNTFNVFYLLVGQEEALGSFGYGIFLLKWEAKELLRVSQPHDFYLQ
jgi:hypothetical protein